MQGHMNRSRLAAVAASAVFTLVPGLVAGVEVANAGVSPLGTSETLPGDTGTPFWPYETGVLVGTSETYADVGPDGSYYDPSLGRRVVLAESARDRIVDDWFRDGPKATARRTSSEIDELASNRSTVSAAPSSPEGFDWGDFGIGAAAMLGLTLLLAACGAGALALRERGGRLTTP